MFSEGTIIAQASAPGVARRGIVRLSGENALRAVASVVYPRDARDDLPPDARLEELNDLSYLVRDQSRPTIALVWIAPWGFDEPGRMVRGALFYWPPGRGFTGERAVELHTLGSQPLLNATIRTVCASGRARLAERGEFTLRAFFSGRIDLTQAEATLGTINAQSDDELAKSLKQLSGSLSREFSELRDLLLDALSELEAGFDFVDEDIEFISRPALLSRIATLLARLRAMLARATSSVGADGLPRVLLFGAPNVGKSSLFNALNSGRAVGLHERALVSEEAGTTRDYLESDLVVDGLRFTLVDAAGLESLDSGSSPSSPRALAQKLIEQLVERADLVLLCYDSESTRKVATIRIEETKSFELIPTLEVVTKSDERRVGLIPKTSRYAVRVSSRTGYGIDELARAIVTRLRAKEEKSEFVTSTALRCQDSLRNAIAALENAREALADDALRDDFLVAAELRLALEQIGLITGRVHTDDLLDRIFSRFCIGK